tara:strand:- start:952 stop:1158 length:207 start_codon:yes stop_codon:yes gene_type:complete
MSKEERLLGYIKEDGLAIEELKVELARLRGEYKSTLRGMLWWDIPNEFITRIEKLIVEFDNKNNSRKN